MATGSEGSAPTARGPLDTRSARARRRARDLLDRAVGLSRSYHFEAHISEPDVDAMWIAWETRLRTEDERDLRRETIGRAYDGAVARLGRLESKAVGVLQVTAIVFAAVAVAALDSAWYVRAVSFAAFAFAVFATLGALQVLRIRQHQQVTSMTAAYDDGGLVATAVAAQAMEVRSTSPANFLHGSLHDLKVAGVLASLALVLVILGWGDAESGRNATATTITTATTPAGPRDGGGSGSDVGRRSPPSVTAPTTNRPPGSATKSDSGVGRGADMREADLPTSR